ncbi:hypothetical protein L1987_10093 [Smallanthus sonchifolius]|uniref:Uncharacterized protein n=1 Tax=Smallanthus sonchifolius TaxID=185202 RepID=A0ACB9JR63_9ASTR|nr:hypothetical protein L1987_10093 [Smallanthus sonchifolius]
MKKSCKLAKLGLRRYMDFVHDMIKKGTKSRLVSLVSLIGGYIGWGFTKVRGAAISFPGTFRIAQHKTKIDERVEEEIYTAATTQDKQRCDMKEIVIMRDARAEINYLDML